MVASSFFKYTISETQTLIKLCLSKCTTSLNSPYCPLTLNGWSGNCWASQAIFWAPVENSGRRAQHRAAQMASVRNKCKIGGNINHNCKWEVLVIAPRVRTRLNITLDIRLTTFKFRYIYLKVDKSYSAFIQYQHYGTLMLDMVDPWQPCWLCGLAAALVI